MKRIIIAIFLLVLLFVSISFIVSVFLVKNRLDSQRSGEKFTEIKSPFLFSITPQEDRVSILIIHLKNPGLRNRNRFNLKIIKNSEVIREITFSGLNIGDPSDLKFQFDSIANSKNVDFQIEISASNYQEPILIYTNAQDEPFFRLYYRSGGTLSAIRDWANSWKERFIRNLYFFVLWMIGLSWIIFWVKLDSQKNLKSK